MNFVRFLFNQTAVKYSRIFSRTFNGKTQKFQYNKLVKVNKHANKRPRLTLILREDVKNLGSAGQMVEVKRGYGRNHLIPNRLAVYATDKNKAKYLLAKNEQAIGRTVADPKILSFFENACLEIAVKTGISSWEITKHHVAVECRKKFNIVVPSHCVEIPHPITSCGDYVVDIVINNYVTSKLKCSVVPEVGG